MAVYSSPTVDVDTNTLLQIWRTRRDIESLFCTQLRPNGTPWCPGYPNAQPGIQLQREIITYWWQNVAGQDDRPDLFGNSMAEWARSQGVITTVSPPQPVSQPDTSQSGATQSTASVPTGEFNRPTSGTGGFPSNLPTEQKLLGAGFVLLIVLFLAGNVRKRQETFAAVTEIPRLAPTGGVVTALRRRRR